MSKINQSEINDVAWRACDTFRGVVDPSDYKNYILVMLFWKYVSDVWRDHRDRYLEEYGNDEVRVQRPRGLPPRYHPHPRHPRRATANR